MRRTLLIDGDIYAYQAALSVQRVTEFDEHVAITADKAEGLQDLWDRLSQIQETLNGDNLVIALTDKENFRKDILLTYKDNRKGVAKPILLNFLRRHLIEEHKAIVRPSLEGDDVLGIYLTNPKLLKGHEKVCVSIDKDMKSVPGLHYNPDKDTEVVEVTEEQADYLHMMQTLTGDTADGYKGCPGIGAVKAAKLLEPSDYYTAWDVVVASYKNAGLTEADALVQARVARICRSSDYNYATKRPIPWTPASSPPD
mgnify:CR=1 FL=1